MLEPSPLQPPNIPEITVSYRFPIKSQARTRSISQRIFSPSVSCISLHIRQVGFSSTSKMPGWNISSQNRKSKWPDQGAVFDQLYHRSNAPWPVSLRGAILSDRLTGNSLRTNNRAVIFFCKFNKLFCYRLFILIMSSLVKPQRVHHLQSALLSNGVSKPLFLTYIKYICHISRTPQYQPQHACRSWKSLL